LLAKETEGQVGADIEALCREATLLAIREFLSQSGKSDYSSFAITYKHFQQAQREKEGAKKFRME